MTDTDVADYIPPPSEEKLSKITDSLDRGVLKSLPVVTGQGGANVVNYDQLLDLSKTMATAKYGVPEHLRGNPGDCLAIRELALNSGLSAYGLAMHSYIVKGRLAFDGQALHAVVERNAPLKQRLRYFFSGEGDQLVCTVVGTFRGEETSVEYVSPPIGKITPKNSPLWQTDPRQQLSYLSVRRWAKRYCPDVLLGIVSREELEDSDLQDVSPASPNLMARLPGKMVGAGFQENVVDQGIAAEVEAMKAKKAPTGAADAKDKVSAPEAVPQPAEEKPAPEPPKAPQTPGEYQLYASAWVESWSDPNEIEARWHGERELRAKLKIPLPMRKMMENVVQAKVNKLRRKGK